MAAGTSSILVYRSTAGNAGLFGLKFPYLRACHPLHPSAYRHYYRFHDRTLLPCWKYQILALFQRLRPIQVAPPIGATGHREHPGRQRHVDQERRRSFSSRASHPSFVPLPDMRLVQQQAFSYCLLQAKQHVLTAVGRSPPCLPSIHRWCCSSRSWRRKRTPCLVRCRSCGILRRLFRTFLIEGGATVKRTGVVGGHEVARRTALHAGNTTDERVSAPREARYSDMA